MLHYIWAAALVWAATVGIEQHWNRRVYKLERQDMSEEEGHYTREQYVDMMHMLAEVGVSDPNGHNVTLAALDHLNYNPRSFLEVGMGLGTFSILVAQKYPNAEVVGIDAHQLSVDSANHHLRQVKRQASVAEAAVLKNIRFEKRDQPELNEPDNSYDIITTSMMNHHIFPDEAFVDFLRRVARVGRRALVFQDFHRSVKCLASNLFNLKSVRYIGHENLKLLSDHVLPYVPILGGNDVYGPYRNLFEPIKTANGTLVQRPGQELFIDGGLLSMRRAFSTEEYMRMFAAAGYPVEAVDCRELDKWYEVTQANCRLLCVVDLRWSNHAGSAAETEVVARASTSGTPGTAGNIAGTACENPLVDPWEDIKVEIFAPPAGAPEADKTAWTRAVQTTVDKINGVDYGGPKLLSLIDQEVALLKKLRFNLFCIYAPPVPSTHAL